MRTIRKRISWGFIALSCVLVGSGIINIAEMGRLRKATENIIDAGMQSTEYATDMLNALQKQNSAVLGMVILNNATPSENYHNGVYEFNAALMKATDAFIERFDKAEAQMLAEGVDWNTAEQRHRDALRDKVFTK